MTHYDVLGVQQDATTREIKEAYRNRSRATHPDLHPNDPGKHREFQAVAEAYRVLSDQRARDEYERAFGIPASLSEFFLAHDVGHRITRIMLPSAPLAPVPGVDLVHVIEIPRERLEEGGPVPLPVEHFGEGQELVLPPMSSTGWYCVKGSGEAGVNGADAGDLWLFVTCAEE